MAASFPAMFLSLLIALRIPPALAAVPRSGARDHATTFVPLDGGVGVGFAPRWYMEEGTPAVPAQLFSPNPRYVLSGGGDGLAARQVSLCDAGFHSCVEANAPGTCCPNDRYCYLDENWAAKCCALGVQCEGSLCAADQLYCNATSATTIPAAPPTAHSGNTVTSLVSRTTYAACCNRACSEASFSCESAFGGQCCPYEYKCGTGSACIADPAPATTTAVSTIVPEIPPGCTTSQITCAETDGGGCCNTGSVCTFQTIGAATSNVCAPDPTLGDDGGSSGGLSGGAKVGIGVGVAVGAALVIAAVTWVCVRRRRKRPGTTGTAVSAHEMQDVATVRGGDGDMGDSLLVGPMTPGTHRSAYTDASEPMMPPLHEHGLAYNYHLPDARAGPFTVRDGDGQIVPNPSLAATRPTGPMPFDPDHILRPVEIGDTEARKQAEKDKGNRHLDEMASHDEDPTAGRFELMGSLGSPSPLNPDGETHPTDKGPK
ncbi:hypothetical protein F4824DRAFT_235324 [Ustulina deusta]|nr:hypothetical protein F4824DRAFT_235324 [Ustulina deusta]